MILCQETQTKDLSPSYPPLEHDIQDLQPLLTLPARSHSQVGSLLISSTEVCPTVPKLSLLSPPTSQIKSRKVVQSKPKPFRPLNDILEVGKKLYIWKAYLQSHAFSYRCRYHSSHNCHYLLTVPLTQTNWNQETLEVVKTEGSYQASSSDHSKECKKAYEIRSQEEAKPKVVGDDGEDQDPVPWRSDLPVLRDFIRNHLTFLPTTIFNRMQAMRQNFTLKTIKEEKKNIWDETFPKDIKAAFYPTNCIAMDSKDPYHDNLFRFSGMIPIQVKIKGKPESSIQTHQYYIFATRMMLYQLSLSDQWFLDGTFSVAPPGFEQLLIIIVFIPSFRIFYPAVYILLSGKPEKLYSHAFSSLITVASEQGFTLKPKLLMMDFETGLRNAAKNIFKLEEKAISGCYFHWVKCLMKRAQNLKIIKRRSHNNKPGFIFLGLFKILVHCPQKTQNDFFEEIETLYSNQGENYKKFLLYYKRNWLNHPFLEGLIETYVQNNKITFQRTNNCCELLNRYLGQVFEFVKPRPGYFIAKLKDVEYKFRGDYLSKCQGRNKGTKWNFQKNPLENMTLPYQEILDLCTIQTQEKDFNLKNLKSSKEFLDSVESLVSKYLNVVDFWGFITQKENEDLENALSLENGEIQANENPQIEVDDLAENLESEDELEVLIKEEKGKNEAPERIDFIIEEKKTIETLPQNSTLTNLSRWQVLQDGFQKGLKTKEKDLNCPISINNLPGFKFRKTNSHEKSEVSNPFPPDISLDI